MNANCPMNAAPDRRRFRFAFGLRTLLVAVTLLGTVGYAAYGFVRQAMARKADEIFQGTVRAWDADTVTTREACEASLRLLNAELKVPLADRAKANVAHLVRIETIKRKIDNAICTMGDDSARKAEVNTYYVEAQRLAGGER